MSFFGPIVSQWQIEQAFIKTLKTWIPEYLAEIERQNGLKNKIIPRPPTPESIHGGTDLESYYQDILPEVVVVVEPLGPPELGGSAGYTGVYQVQVGCLWVGSGSELAERPEDEARCVVSHYGAACMGIVQQPGLGGLADDLRMEGLPRISLPNTDKREIAQVETTFHVWVSEIILPNEGPVQPNPVESPEYGGEPEAPFSEDPTVEKVTVDINAEQI